MAKQLIECYPKEVNADFLEDYSVHQISKDCTGEGDSGSGGDNDCLSKWKDKKEEANSKLEIANAAVSKATKKVENIMHWEAKLKVYWESIEKTDEIANKVAREIYILKCYVESFCTNAECMVEALEILYCETRTIYDPCVNEMVILIDRINKCLVCITDPAFDRSQGITKAIDAYAAKLKELADLQKDALTKIVKALECANIIFYTICDTTDKKQDFKCDSLEKEIEALLINFGNCQECSDDDEGISCDPLICTSMCKNLEPIPVMPLCKDPYFKETQSEYEQAKKDREEAKNELDKAKEEQQAAFMYFSGVSKAIEASNKAKAG